MFVSLHDAGVITSAIFPHAHQTVNKGKKASHNRRNDDYYESRNIARRVFWLEDEGPNKIACRKTSAQFWDAIEAETIIPRQ